MALKCAISKGGIFLTPRVLVVNAGTHPEPAHLAAGLIEREFEVTYATSATWTSDHLLVKLSRSRMGRRIPVLRDVARRVLPPAITKRELLRVGGLAEATFQAARRLNGRLYRNALLWRTAVFRERMSRRFASVEPFDAVIAQYTGALDVFEQAGDRTLKVLAYPIAHHRWVMRTMREEAERNPDWAGSLQGNDFTDEQLAALDREVELANFVLVPSTFVKRTFEEFGVTSDRILVQPLGADTDELFDSDNREMVRDPRNPFRVLFVGQLTQRKGISYLVEGFHKAAVPESTLRFVGAPVGDIANRLAGYESVEVMPSTPRSALGNHYSWADVLVLPSLAEGFPLVAIEAMSCGTPCIVSASTFAHDVITDGVDGYVVPPADSDAIVHALRLMAGDRARVAALSESARKTASRFTWDRYRIEAAAIIDAAITPAG